MGLLGAMSNYNQLHQFDGYSSEDIGNLSKEKPQLRSEYNKAMDLKAKYEIRSGQKRNVRSFKNIM